MIINQQKYYIIDRGEIRVATEGERFTNVEPKTMVKGFCGIISIKEKKHGEIMLNFLSLPVVKDNEEFFFEISGNLDSLSEDRESDFVTLGIYKSREEASEAFDSMIENRMSLVKK